MDRLGGPGLEAHHCHGPEFGSQVQLHHAASSWIDSGCEAHLNLGSALGSTRGSAWLDAQYGSFRFDSGLSSWGSVTSIAQSLAHFGSTWLRTRRSDRGISPRSWLGLGSTWLKAWIVRLGALLEHGAVLFMLKAWGHAVKSVVDVLTWDGLIVTLGRCRGRKICHVTVAEPLLWYRCCCDAAVMNE